MPFVFAFAGMGFGGTKAAIFMRGPGRLVVSLAT